MESSGGILCPKIERNSIVNENALTYEDSLLHYRTEQNRTYILFDLYIVPCHTE